MKCGILFTRSDFKDISGCLKAHGHLDHHICKTKEGDLMAYDYDFECNCDDCKTDDINDMCIIYWTVKKITD